MSFQKKYIQVLLCLFAGFHAALATNCTAIGQSCAADCVTLTTCIDVDVPPIFSHLCQYPTPHCLNGRCSIAPDTSDACQAPPVDFQCTAQGVFPNPQDCTQYYVCQNSSSEALNSQCPTGFVYSPRDRFCQVGDSSNCPTLSKTCADPRNANRLVRFSNDAPAYFGYCSTTSAPVVFRCKDDQNDIYDEEQSSCRYNCKRDGQFVNRFDCNGFVLCRQLHGRWTPQEFKCPETYKFSDGSCVSQGGTNCTSELVE